MEIFMIGNCHAGSSNPQIFEINRQKEVVWQFNQWNLVGDGLACWQIFRRSHNRDIGVD